MVKIIDLSVPTEDSPSESLPVKVAHEPHQQSVEMMKMFFGCSERDVPQGLGWANDKVTLGATVGLMSMLRGTISPLLQGREREQLTRCPWNGSITMGWCWT